MPAMAFVDGEIVPLAEARVPITDRGLLWGDHVFEVLRTANGNLCDGEAHLDRLAISAARVGLAAPDRSRIERAMTATVAAAGGGDLALRVMWTGGDGGRLGERHGAPRLLVTAEPIEPGRARPVRLAVVHAPRVAGLVPADAKTGNYLPSILGLAAARAAGADDVVFAIDGVALETASASLFVVGVDGTIATPTGALLPGVTAARVTALLAERGRRVAHRPVPLAELAAAAELFTTSSRRGVVPVVALDGVPRAPGPVARLAGEVYDAWIDRVARGDGAGLRI
ncbi:MAG TPA: aminotransferase class IV [Kofleriaceae bacterium]|jgi:branched-subunit amino acid aminotransferase/4-amino-4-deoxychorismate lyase|nr:aminotransferase class IV [Kofleriaceae bacterium]